MNRCIQSETTEIENFIGTVCDEIVCSPLGSISLPGNGIAMNDELFGDKSNGPVSGIDTVKVGYTVQADKINWEGWTKQEISKITQNQVKWKKFFNINWYKTPNNSFVTLKYIPADFMGRPLNLLLLEFSLPKLLFGNNYCNIDNWQFALDYVNATFANIPGLPQLGDVRDAILYRLDLCANFMVGASDINDYLQGVSRAKHPHREKVTYVDSNVVFPTKEIRTLFYDKYRESKKKAPEGTFHVEIQMLRRHIIGEWVGKKQPTLRNITPRMIMERLLKELKILHLDKPMVCNPLELERILSKKYSKCRVLRMRHYWEDKQKMTRREILDRGYKSRTICYWERLFREAGVSSNSVWGHKTLAPLSDFLEDNEEICNKPLSDTTGIVTNQNEMEV